MSSFFQTRRWFSFGIAAALLAVSSACSTSTTNSISTSAASSVQPLQSEKYAAIVVDAATGKTLYARQATEARYPASMTKMMTLYLLFEAMETRGLTRDSIIPVSRNAAAKPPTKLGFKDGEGIRVDDAIKALITRSANDVAAAIGEFISGSEEQFAVLMTQKARSLGMRQTTFRNASGLPDNEQMTSARDMATLAIMLRRQFPQYYFYFSVTEFQFRGNTIRGHNRLVSNVAGVDGLKTGYIRASGFNVATSVARNGKRLVVVVMGGKSGAERDAHVAELIEAFLPMPGGQSGGKSLPGPLAVLDPSNLDQRSPAE